MDYTETKPYIPSKEALELLKLLRPMDDDFMREMFRNNLPLAQMVLRIITGIEDLVLLREETQYDMNRLLDGRSLCLDVFASDSKGQYYDIEVQRADRGAIPQRARYHSAAMDVELLKKGHGFAELPMTYVIFITEKDIYKKGLPLYPVERMITTIETSFDDGEHILFVNGAYQGEDAIGRLMHDFRCSSANDMYYAMMAEKVRFLKENDEGVSDVCKLIEDKMEEIRTETEKRVKAETEKRVKAETEKRVKAETVRATILNLLRMGILPAEKIATAVDSPVETVYRIAQDNHIELSG